MQIASINSGKVAEKTWRKGALSAITKTTVGSQRQKIETSGLLGDEQADTKNHGGKDKAILILPSSAYQRFAVNQPFGYLGENLTLHGADEAEICLGDRLQIGTVLLEVSQPRTPCWKLDRQVADLRALPQGEFLQAYSQSGHVGFYCRVLAIGEVKQGQNVMWLTRDKAHKEWPKISIKNLFLAKLNFKDKASIKTLQQALQHPALSAAWQKELQAILSRQSIGRG